MRNVARLALLTTSLLAFTAPASAALVVITGTTNGSPTYNRATEGGALSTVGTAVAYDAISFQVDVSGAYTLGVHALTFGYDTFISLYQGGFNPNAPLANLLESDDDDGLLSNSLLTRNLIAGTTYVGVITGFNNGDRGAYLAKAFGPGTASAVAAVPEPATWAMMISGFGLIGGALRSSARERRRALAFA